jgi:hypothetical protein
LKRAGCKPPRGLKSVRFLQFFIQLALQMSPGGFLYRAALGRHGLLLSLALAARSLVNFARQMRDLGAVCADLSFVRLGVKIHRSWLI